MLPAARAAEETKVATREGGVDRNFFDAQKGHFVAVATREGGVDRNLLELLFLGLRQLSPPARVAWIETHTA